MAWTSAKLSARRVIGTSGKPHLNSGRLRQSRSIGLALCLLLAAPAAALDLVLPPGSALTAEDELISGAQLPIGISHDGKVPRADFTGKVQRSAYFIPGAEGTLALSAPLAAQLKQSGWSILVDCASAACGGFDFRFALDVLPEPAMHVDLGDFRYLAAQNGAEMLAVLASKRGSAGYLQITYASDDAAAADPNGGAVGSDSAPGTRPAAGQDPVAGPGSDAPGSGSAPDGADPSIKPVPRPIPVVVTPGSADPELQPGGSHTPGEMGQALEAFGRVVLDDLVFATGSSTLGPDPFATLTELAAYLSAHPGRKLALVGHTDATGGLEVNITVSRRRAQSVLEHLVSQYKIPRSQLSAEGVGYLSPLRSNLTAEGQSANRRVEAVLLPTE